MPLPSRGEVWLVDFDPVRGHEQGGRRPAVVVSTDQFNHGASGLVVVVPTTTRERGLPLHVAVTPPDGGLRQRSFIKIEDVRAIARERLVERWGTLSPGTLAVVEHRLRTLLEL